MIVKLWNVTTFVANNLETISDFVAWQAAYRFGL